MNTCPRCKNQYDGYPALSRLDNKTKICSACGTDEAMQDYMCVPLTNFLEEGTMEDKLNVQRLIDAGFTESEIQIMIRAYQVTHDALGQAFKSMEESGLVPEGLDMAFNEVKEAYKVSVEINEKINKWNNADKTTLPDQFRAWMDKFIKEEEENN